MNPKWKSVNKIKNERNKSGVVGVVGVVGRVGRVWVKVEKKRYDEIRMKYILCK